MHARPSKLLRWSTAASIVVLLAVLVLWATSHYRCFFFSSQGRVLVLVVKADDQAEGWLRSQPPTVALWEALRPEKMTKFAGLRIGPIVKDHRHTYTYYRGTAKGEGGVELSYWEMAVPYWMLALVAGGVASACVALTVRAGARRRAGRCVNCGYDLRESPGRCPECGAGAGK